MVKVLVIGLDGGELSLIKKWKDELPNLRKFLEKGVCGVLESTVPPITSPAWNSMFTGKNPAKIGIFSWIVFDSKNQPQVVNLTYQDSPSIWDILGGYGLKVGVMNVPTAYPPAKVNGFMVCGGLLTVLSRKLGYTFPPSLKDELDRVSGGYEIIPLADLNIAGWEDEYIEAFNMVISKQVKAAKYLMKRYAWDLFINVFFILDSVQHYFWAHMDTNHPRHDPTKARKYGNTIKEFYKKIDNAIGEIVCEIEGDVNLIIVSDHGFGPCYGHFCINDWLEENGFLALKQQQGIRGFISKKIVSSANFVISNINLVRLEAVLRIVPSVILRWFTLHEKQKRERIEILRSIDWSRTRAYEAGDGIFINRMTIGSKKEYEELRDNITRMLYEILDPRTGRKVITKVFRKEEIYQGKYLDRAPDLFYLTDFRGDPLISSQVTGFHRLNGVFIAHGPDVKKTGKEVQGIKIYDITPTILHIFGIPVPKDMDGGVLKHVFEEDSELAKKPIVYQETDEERLAERKEVFSSEDEERIKERLRRLGYL